MNTSWSVRRFARLGSITLATLLIAACVGKSPESLVGSAKEYLSKNDYPAAIIQLKNALQAAPDNGEARLLLGRALLEQRDFVSAEKELRRALELGQPADTVLPTLAKAMVALRQFEKLTKEFGGQSLGSAEAQAVFVTLIGDANREQNRLTEAEAAYAAALRAQPGYGQAMLAAMGGDRAAAMKIADEVAAASPKLAEAHALRADLLYAEGKSAEARQAR